MGQVRRVVLGHVRPRLPSHGGGEGAETVRGREDADELAAWGKKAIAVARAAKGRKKKR